jgi:hypothetical protein
MGGIALDPSLRSGALPDDIVTSSDNAIGTRNALKWLLITEQLIEKTAAGMLNIFATHFSKLLQ